ncbi:MAG: hypothetical protein Q8L79_18830 [Methylobacter sp.]|uniref:hypothetical protein n=1 Tax=Methylobacter sp. TaxID=2051955 RepID=UPI0027303CC2|nr:hypothetical protein [Methylobacter sp.]MDP1667164.1 hypothetical protein [Methylobacter sp.]
MNDCLSAYQSFNALKENLFDIRANIGKSSLFKSELSFQLLFTLEVGLVLNICSIAKVLVSFKSSVYKNKTQEKDK